MGLSASQSRYLFLTGRKADCELGLAVNSNRKMSLAREQTQLTQKYNSLLNTKQISFRNGGQYQKINYNYLMGYGARYTAVTDGTMPVKSSDHAKTVLTDYNGRVVIANDYVKYFSMVGLTPDSQGRGQPFGEDKIAELILIIAGGGQPLDLEQSENANGDGKTSLNADVQKILDIKNKGATIEKSFAATVVNSRTGESTGKTSTVDNSANYTAQLQAIMDFYWPIFKAASINGWTTEYNLDMAHNEDYISDALVSGTFQLADVKDSGCYQEDNSLTYFVTQGVVQSRTDSTVRAQIDAWYDAEKARINEKETSLDLENQDLSTELEAIKTELNSVKSLIEDAESVFEWGA